LAADGVTGASKRWFDGEVVIVKTAAGREFTCTPNHPILTDRGWLAAGLLDVGGNIVGYRGGDWVALTGGDGKNVPAPIHEIAEAVFAAELVSPVPMIPTAEDFHGDGEGSEIAIVWSDRLLSYTVDASLDQHLGEFGFIGGGLAGLVPFAGGGHSADYFERLDAPACCAVSLSDLSLALGRRHLGPLESLGLAVPALGDPMIPKNSGYDYSFNLELLGDSILRDAADVGPANRCLIDEGARPGWYAAMLQFAHDDAVRNPALAADLSGIEPGNVELDTVVELKRIGFSDHVYNLETSTGWYVAQGVVSHNCRCVATPIPKGIDEIFGTTGLDQQMQPQTRASKDGPTNAITFDAFLKRQSPEFVEDMLGAHRAAMWRAGKITLKDLVSGTGRPLTLAQLQAQ
jgi:hypothetical protein